MPEVRKIPMLLIDEPPLALREAMDEHKLRDLAENMGKIGLLQPIGVIERGQKFEIEFGHRRYLAAKMLDWIDISAVVFKPDQIHLRAAMLAENMYREDNTAVEVGAFLAQIMEMENLDTDGVASRVHKSRDYVEQRLALLTGDPDVINAVRARDISFSVARIVNSVEDEAMRKYFLDLAVRVGYRARQLNEMVKNWRCQANGSVIPETKPADMPAVQAQQAEEEGCFLCGGNKDRYNMSYVLIHHQCKRRIEDIISESATAGK